MTEAEVRAITGDVAFPIVWERVTRLRERGYESRVFLDAKGDIVIEVTAVLSEGPTSDYDSTAGGVPETRESPVQPAEPRSAASGTLTLSEAVALLPDTPKVHTWKNDGLGVFSAHLPKGEVVNLMQRFGVRRAKSAAERLSHGLRIETPGGIIFVQTRSE